MSAGLDTLCGSKNSLMGRSALRRVSWKQWKVSQRTKVVALWHVTYPERLEGVCYTHKSFHGGNKLEQRRLSRKESRVFVCCRKVDSGRCERVVIYRLADQTPDTATRLRAQRPDSRPRAARAHAHADHPRSFFPFFHVAQAQCAQSSHLLRKDTLVARHQPARGHISK